VDPAEARAVLTAAEEVCPAAEVAAAIRRLAGDITARLGNAHPLVLAVMSGAVYFAGQLLPLLRFPLEFDYIHATRYRGTTAGGGIEWRALPASGVAGRTVLVLDDILDEGPTLAAIRQRLVSLGAQEVLTAVLADKAIGRPKPLAADFIGLTVPDRYVFGCGMDVHGAWRNLPAIYAVKAQR
jgi:hypoxanthine phosphoribosyltransferase